MKTLVLDGSQANDPQAAHLRAALQSRLPEAEIITLREQKIGNCAGDFFCWIRNPGICNAADDNRTIAAKVVNSDLLIYLTPVTFGGYASALKRMVDHQIQNISPYFALVNGETHHQRRYAHYPNLLVIGWMETADPQAEAIFRSLVQRNALNMYAQTVVCGVGTPEWSAGQWETQLQGWLKAVESRQSSPAPAVPPPAPSGAHGAPPKRAVLLVGSPRTHKSTSAILGGYVLAQLARQGVAAETIQLYPAFSSTARAQTALAAIDAADLVVLAFPLYVDSLPAPVIAALETIHQHRALQPQPAEPGAPRPRFMAIANCGFPEAHHNDNALAACAAFARQSGMDWAGGLALGAGEGLVHGVPLEQLGGRAIPVQKAFDLAAQALAQGQPVPAAAQAQLAKPIIHPWMYRLAGGFGWKQQARKYGAQRRMKAQPYKA